MKILIVDDVQEYADSLSRALEAGHETVVVNNLEDGKRRMDNSVGLALVDVRLSEEDIANRDGIMLLSWLRENYPSVPVVMMSAYRDFDAALDTLNLGACRFLKKPISLRELKEVIAACQRQ